MKRIVILVAALLAVVGCGGGGGGPVGTASIVGRVLDIQTGGPPSPQASVGVPSAGSVLTAVEDGSFTLSANAGSNQLLVTSQYPTFSFTTASASGTTDVGDLWIGPQKITLNGRIVDSATSIPVTGAKVAFAGVSGTTNGSGVFSLAGVAYADANQASFWGIVGVVKATNYFDQNFTSSPNVAVAGVVDVGDIIVTPSNNTTPPGDPFDITGRVLPIGGSTGAVVTLKLGGSAVRTFNVGSDGVYTFWVPAGSYTITYAKAAQTAPTQNATVVQQNIVVHVPDVTLQ